MDLGLRIKKGSGINQTSNAAMFFCANEKVCHEKI